MWWKPYESILERKPVAAKDALVDLLAKELEEVISAFPPAESEIDWSDAALQKRLQGRLHTLPPVDVPVAEILAAILIFELKHEPEAVDHLLRNDRHEQACPTADHDDALHFLWRGTLEHLYVRKEDANGALKSKDLVIIVEKFLARFKSKALAVN